MTYESAARFYDGIPLTSLGGGKKQSYRYKLTQINWGLVVLLSILAGIGFAMLYSAANGSYYPWALPQMVRFVFGLGAMIFVAVIDIRLLYRWSYLFYAISLLLLVAVMVHGTTNMGAQRWLNLGLFQVQPSEISKLTLVLVLARYFHGASIEDTGRVFYLVIPLILLALPVALIAKQPDLGTALMMLIGTAMILFIVGVRWWKFGLAALGIGGLVPVGWNFLHDYQKARVRVFLNPDSDPLGAGYHIIQSKIALGSGGIDGKGYLMGTQSHLNFLPEKQNDFIFTMLAEEFGMIGGLTLLALYAVVIIYGYAIAFRSHSQFGRIVALGIVSYIFISVFINVAMVMGMIPAKGVPLPMVSYGGTSLIVTMIGFGLLMNVWVHRDVKIGWRSASDD